MAETRDSKSRMARGQQDRARSSASLLSFMWTHIAHDRILLSAASLAFQTLLSLVPLMAVILSMLKVFPVFASLKRYMGDFLFQNFAPSQGALLKEYLWEFIDKTSSVSTIGGIFLIVMALFLISTIDQTLNGIWEVHAPRKLLQGFTLYWTVLTLGPVFIGTSLLASSFVWYALFTDGALLEMKTRLLSFIPFLNSIVAFFLLYMLVPNRRVRFIHACAGGVLAAILFELAKKWFAFYVANFATFEHIYGALSVIPMLFFWIYLEWIVVLIGAEFVFSLGYFSPLQRDSREFDPLQGVPGIIVVLRSIWSAQESGSFITMKKLFAEENIADRSKLSRIVEFLVQGGVVHQTADGGLAVSADLHSLTLYELYSTIPSEIVYAERGMEELPASAGLAEVRDGVREALRSTMHVPLIALVNDSTKADL
ncbi:MAG: YihY family inner membrane protein [Chlorobiaceae bacterium]|nr:YihY family inner membrane protein [Chlorobiaceae bacterium]